MCIDPFKLLLSGDDIFDKHVSILLCENIYMGVSVIT